MDEKELKNELTKIISQNGWADILEVDIEEQVNVILELIKARENQIRIDELKRLKFSTGDIVLVRQEDPINYAHDIVVSSIANRIDELTESKEAHS